MKKIVRITESDLTRIVKRVISENSDLKKYQALLNSVDGLGTNDKDFFEALYSIKDKNEYNRINSIAKSKGEDIPTLFDGDFDDKESTTKFCSFLFKLSVPLPEPCKFNLYANVNPQIKRTTTGSSPR